MTYLFGDCELDPDLHELQIQERVIAVEPQVLGLLVYLIEHRDRLIGREELNQQIWDGRFVSEWALSTCIKNARLAIGDSGKQQDYIRTYPRRGFRFVGKVGVRDQGQDAAARETAAAAIDATIPSPTNKPSIAVLPFDNMSGDPEQECFSDGIAEDVITALSKISRLRVVARHSSFAYKEKSLNVRDLADDLGVHYVLEGSVRSVGSRIRVTAQLIDARDDTHIWGEKFDRKVDDVFDIQDEITKEIVTHLRVQLADGEHALMLSRGTNSVEAWQYCVQALDLWLRLNASDHLAARDLAEKAIGIDPNYAAAWALVGWTHHFDWKLGRGGDDKQCFDEAANAAAKALNLDEDNPYAIGINIFVAGASGQHGKGINIAKKGLDRMPGSADVRSYFSYALMHTGRIEESIENFEAAITLNPLTPNWYLTGYSRALMYFDRFDESLEVIERILADEPRLHQAWLQRSFIYQQTDQNQKARVSMMEAMRLAPSFRLQHVPKFFFQKNPILAKNLLEAFRKSGLPE